MPGAVEELLVFLRANTSDFEKKMTEAGAQVESFGTKGSSGLAKFASFGGAALAVTAAAAAFVGVASFKMADDFEKSHARLESAVKNAGLSFEHEKGAIDKVDKSMEHFGFNAADTENALSRLIPVTGSVSKAQKDLSVAVDIAAARHISLEAATNLLVKAENGNYGALTRLGVASKDQVKQFQNSGQAVDFLAQKFHGQGEAAANTFGGKMKALGATLEDVGIKIGLKLIPVVQSMADVLGGTVSFFAHNEAAAIALGGAIATVLVPAMLTFIALKVGAAIAAITENFSLGVTAVRVYASELADAAGGASGIAGALGTMGIALAPLAGLYAITGGAIFDFSDASDKAAKAARGWAVAAVQSSEKAVGSTALAKVTQQDLAKDVDRLQARYKALQTSIADGSWSRYGKTLIDVQHEQLAVGNQIDHVKGKHQALSEAIKKTEKAIRDNAEAEVRANSTSGTATKAAIDQQIAQDKLAATYDKAAKAAQQYSDALFSAFDAQFALIDATKQLADDSKDSSKSQEDLQKDILAVTKAAGENAAQQLGPGASAADKSAASKQAEIAALQGLIVAYPKLQPVIQGYIDKIKSVPDAKNTAFTGDDANLQAAVSRAHGYLDGLPPSKQIEIIANLQIAGQAAAFATLVAFGNVKKALGLASGGSIPGSPGTPYPVIAHGGEVVLNHSQVQALNQGAVLSGRGATGGGDTYIIHVAALTPAQAADAVVDALGTHVRRNGSARLKKMVA